MLEAGGEDEVPAPALQLAGSVLRGGREDAGQEDLLGGPRVLPPDSPRRRGEHPFEAWLVELKPHFTEPELERTSLMPIDCLLAHFFRIKFISLLELTLGEILNFLP